MARIEKTVFISYRRKDISWALAVYQYLTNQKYDVFFDYISIPSGDFEQIIVSNIRARAHFILILTPPALDRCSEPGDWLRREIETAIDEKRNIIPLFFEGFSFGSASVAEKLTGKLSNLRRYNGLEIPSGYFIEAMKRLHRRYLSVPLDAVIHPVSTEVWKVVQKEQIAADKALEQKRDDIEELVKTAEVKPSELRQEPDRKVPHAAENPVNEVEKLRVAEENTRFESRSNWQLPSVENVLDKGRIPEINEQLIEHRARIIQETLASFGAPVQVVEINYGPSITQYGVEPLFVKARSGRVKVRASKIENLADEIAVALAVRNVRIQVPVPGRSYIGIEVPNEKLIPVALRDVIESKLFKRDVGPLKFVLGRDVIGQPVIISLEKMPHLLIAGASQSGKSVCVDAILSCLLLHNTPNNLRLMLIDPKRIELSIYNGIPHLVAPVIVEIERVTGALQWVTYEMDKRYHTFDRVGARNIFDYNGRMEMSGSKKLPFLVVVISEFANLMMAMADETEQIITRLAHLGRNTGIHVILTTQRLSVDVLTRQIKSNFPARITFVVASNSESRAILDQSGAERLLGHGDMLFQAPDALPPMRLQGAFISSHEIQNLLEFWRNQLEQNIPVPEATDLTVEIEPIVDPLLPEAIELVRREGRASVSMLQRHMKIGYTRAARIVDIMEDKGIVGPPEGPLRIRKILDYGTISPPNDI